MKQFLITVLKGVISFIVLFFMIMLTWSLILAILRTLNNEISNTDSTLILAIVSAIASIISLFVSKWLDRQSALFIEAKKVNQPIYQEIIEKALNKNLNKQELKAQYMPFIVSHSSDNIYNAFIDFCDNEKSNVNNLIEVVRKELKLTAKSSK